MKKIAIFALLCAFLLCACAPETKKQGYAMDTYYTFDIVGEDCVAVAEENAQILLDVENILSVSLVSSDVYKINSGEVSSLSGMTKDVFELSLNFEKMTDGAFCPALKNLTDLWDIGGKNYVPTDEETAAALKVCGTDKIEYETKDYFGEIKTNGVKIDFGGIAKGYALDLIYENTKQNGASGLIDLGGSIAAIGAKKDGSSYKVGIKGESGVVATAELKDAFVSTSGIYERYFEEGGTRYHHILDIKTGKPAQNNIYGVSVIAKSGVFTDAMSTALFVMGEEKGVSFANKEDIAAVFVLNDGSIIITDAAEEYNIDIL